MGIFDQEAQARAIERLQRQVWQAVVDQFRKRQEAGLRQVDLAQQLGISPPQVHLWLTAPSRLTLKAAARLMLALDGEFAIAASGPRRVECGPCSGASVDAAESAR